MNHEELYRLATELGNYLFDKWMERHCHAPTLKPDFTTRYWVSLKSGISLAFAHRLVGDCDRSRVRCPNSAGLCMPKLFQIKDDDLATLERAIPQIADRLYTSMDNRLRVQLRQVQQILSDVRWNYGPPSDITVIPPDGEDHSLT